MTDPIKAYRAALKKRDQIEQQQYQHPGDAAFAAQLAAAQDAADALYPYPDQREGAGGAQPSGRENTAHDEWGE